MIDSEKIKIQSKPRGLDNSVAEAFEIISSKPSRAKKSNLVSTQPSKEKANGVEVELNSSDGNDAEPANEGTNAK